jgi:hypothetical protein
MPNRMLSPNAPAAKWLFNFSALWLFITIFNCRYHTSNHLSVCHKPTSLSPINCQSVDNCDGIDKPQKCQNVCYHPTHQQQSDFLIFVLYDFIVQNILSSLLLLCYRRITVFDACFYCLLMFSFCLFQYWTNCIPFQYILFTFLSYL